jgi:hypothetical protein
MRRLNSEPADYSCAAWSSRRRGGARPVGLAAAVYGASEGLDTVPLDAVGTGGQAAASSRIAFPACSWSATSTPAR